MTGAAAATLDVSGHDAPEAVAVVAFASLSVPVAAHRITRAAQGANLESWRARDGRGEEKDSDGGA